MQGNDRHKLARSRVEEEEEEVYTRPLTPDVLSGGPSWSGLYGPVLTLMAPPWLVAGNVVPSAARAGDASIAPTSTDVGQYF